MGPKMDDISKLPGIKERELIALGNCKICGKRLLEDTGVPLFYVIEISRAGFVSAAVRRRVGLSMMLNDNDFLAGIMGPDEDLAKVLEGPRKVVVHESCADRVSHLLQLLSD